MFAKVNAHSRTEDDDDENDYDSPNAWEPYFGLSYIP
jgi:hypothetical protein